MCCASIRGMLKALSYYQRPVEGVELVLEYCWMHLIDIRRLLDEFHWIQMLSRGGVLEYCLL